MKWNKIKPYLKMRRMPIMTRFILCLQIVLFGACNSSSKESKSIMEETTKTVKNVQKAEDFRERLKAMDPATEAELKNWLPTAIGDFNRTEFGTSHVPQNEIASAEATYTIGDNDKKLVLRIVDGASKSGLIAIGSHYMAQNLDIDNVKNSGHEKTYEKNGLKVLETYVKKISLYRINFLYDMRFGITVEGYHLNQDELWQIIDKLKVEQLRTL